MRESRFGRDVKLMVLGELATYLHNERQRDFRSTDINTVVKKVFSSINKINSSALESELLTDGLIVQAGSSFQFSHLSFQEFLAAKTFIGSPTRTRIRKALRQFLEGDDWWLEVIKFYISLSGSPRELINWLNDEASWIGIATNDIRLVQLYFSVAESYPDYTLDSTTLSLVTRQFGKLILTKRVTPKCTKNLFVECIYDDGAASA